MVKVNLSRARQARKEQVHFIAGPTSLHAYISPFHPDRRIKEALCVKALTPPLHDSAGNLSVQSRSISAIIWGEEEVQSTRSTEPGGTRETSLVFYLILQYRWEEIKIVLEKDRELLDSIIVELWG